MKPGLIFLMALIVLPTVFALDANFMVSVAETPTDQNTFEQMHEMSWFFSEKKKTINSIVYQSDLGKEHILDSSLVDTTPLSLLVFDDEFISGDMWISKVNFGGEINFYISETEGACRWFLLISDVNSESFSGKRYVLNQSIVNTTMKTNDVVYISVDPNEFGYCKIKISDDNSTLTVNATFNELYPDFYEKYLKQLVVGEESGDLIMSYIGSDQNFNYTAWHGRGGLSRKEFDGLPEQEKIGCSDEAYYAGLSKGDPSSTCIPEKAEKLSALLLKANEEKKTAEESSEPEIFKAVEGIREKIQQFFVSQNEQKAQTERLLVGRDENIVTIGFIISVALAGILVYSNHRKKNSFIAPSLRSGISLVDKIKGGIKDGIQKKGTADSSGDDGGKIKDNGNNKGSYPKLKGWR